MYSYISFSFRRFIRRHWPAAGWGLCFAKDPNTPKASLALGACGFTQSLVKIGAAELATLKQSSLFPILTSELSPLEIGRGKLR
jgi:hypothetical protein